MIDTVAMVANKYELDLTEMTKTNLFKACTQQNLINDVSDGYVDRYGNTWQGNISCIKPFNDTLRIEISRKYYEEKPCLKLSCSVPKFLTGSNLILADAEKTQLFTRRLKDTLEMCGIYTDVDKLEITRLDLTKNLQLNHAVNCYIPVIKDCVHLYNPSKNWSQYGMNTYTVAKNKKEHICFYDKKAEMKNNLIPGNLGRLELRLEDKKQVQKVANVMTLYDLYQSHEKLIKVYQSEVEKMVFKDKTIPYNKLSNDFESLIMNSIQEYNGKERANLAKIFIMKSLAPSIESLLDDLMDNFGLDKLLDIQSRELEKYGQNKNVINKSRSQMRKYLQELHEDIHKMDSLASATLYEELYDKILGK